MYQEVRSQEEGANGMNPLITTIVLIMVAMSTGLAQAQPDSKLFVNGAEQIVGTGNPQILKIQSGQIYSTIHIEEPETISCTLENCVASVQVDNTFGGYVAKVSGTMTNQTSQIQLVNSQGQVTYTIVMETEQKQVVTQDPQSTFGIQIPQVPNFVWVIFGVVGVIAVLLWSKSRGMDKIVAI